MTSVFGKIELECCGMHTDMSVCNLTMLKEIDGLSSTGEWR